MRQYRLPLYGQLFQYDCLLGSSPKMVPDLGNEAELTSVQISNNFQISNKPGLKKMHLTKSFNSNLHTSLLYMYLIKLNSSVRSPCGIPLLIHIENFLFCLEWCLGFDQNLGHFHVSSFFENIFIKKNHDVLKTYLFDSLYIVCTHRHKQILFFNAQSL